MRRLLTRVSLVLLILPLAGCAGRGVTAHPAGSPSPSAQPYAGLQDRPIRALAPERVEELLAGRGAGYALAAELNHYPGPMHVLQAAGELRLSPDQERATRDTFAAMQQEAQELGRRLVDLEAELDRGFRTGEMTPTRLAQLTSEIAAVEGQLRHTHLAAHLRMKEILSADQVARYDQLRGYTPADSTPAADGTGEGAHSGRQHGQR